MVLTDADFGRGYLVEGWARRFLVELFRHCTVLFVGYKPQRPDRQLSGARSPGKPGGAALCLGRRQATMMFCAGEFSASSQLAIRRPVLPVMFLRCT
jgi:hypothetical protein